jgi:hypothetical protein
VDKNGFALAYKDMNGCRLTTERSILTITGPSLSVQKVNSMVMGVIWCRPDAPKVDVLELQSTELEVPGCGRSMTDEKMAEINTITSSKG